MKQSGGWTKQLLAGAAAAAAVVLTALAGWALFGPKAPPPAAREGTAPGAAVRIAQHARALEGQVKGMRYIGTEESLARPRVGYRVTFATADPAPVLTGDDAANAARLAAWRQRFCTHELHAEMAAHGVEVVTGQVVGDAGGTRYVADCLAGRAAPQAGPGGPLL